jgi:hypothetical protein
MTILQTVTVEEMRGRVMSLFMLDNGLVPAFAFAGVAVELIGILIGVAAAWAALRVRVLRSI